MVSGKQEDIAMENGADERQRETGGFQKALQEDWINRVKKVCEEIEALMMAGQTR